MQLSLSIVMVMQRSFNCDVSHVLTVWHTIAKW